MKIKCPCGKTIMKSQEGIFFVCDCGREYRVGKRIELISDFLPRLNKLREVMM